MKMEMEMRGGFVEGIGRVGATNWTTDSDILFSQRKSMWCGVSYGGGAMA